MSVEKKFLLLQEESLQDLRRRWEDVEGRNYLVCPELECPVCLLEMVPPTRIWQCRSVSVPDYNEFMGSQLSSLGKIEVRSVGGVWCWYK